MVTLAVLSSIVKSGNRPGLAAAVLGERWGEGGREDGPVCQAVGVEDVEDLLADIEQALAKA